MASELRVDKIKPVDGVSTDSGNNRYGGGIIQVVQSYGNGAETQTSSTSYVATGTAATITPKFSTSKIMVEVMGGTCSPYQNQGMNVSVYRSINGGSFTALHGVSGRPSNSLWRVYCNSGRVQMGCAIKVLDAPATTNSVEYKVYIASIGGNGCQFNNHFYDHASITLTEHSA